MSEDTMEGLVVKEYDEGMFCGFKTEYLGDLLQKYVGKKVRVTVKIEVIE